MQIGFDLKCEGAVSGNTFFDNVKKCGCMEADNKSPKVWFVWFFGFFVFKLSLNCCWKNSGLQTSIVAALSILVLDLTASTCILLKAIPIPQSYFYC